MYHSMLLEQNDLDQAKVEVSPERPPFQTRAGVQLGGVWLRTHIDVHPNALSAALRKWADEIDAGVAGLESVDGAEATAVQVGAQ